MVNPILLSDARHPKPAGMGHLFSPQQFPGGCIFEAALPFKDDKKTVRYDKFNESDDDEEYDDEERDEAPVEDFRALRISTRARLTYNLERYNKNAMLVFNSSSAVAAEIDRIPERVAAIVETFSKFRFEIENHVELTEQEIYEKCEEYFRRDFSEYGCVAVVVLSLEGMGFVASRIVRHWTADGNPTLQHKPKLYFNESSLRLALREQPYPIRPPISENHPDVLWLHLPAIFHITAPQPFQVFCEKLTEMADFDDMMTIIKMAIKETKVVFRFKIHVGSTLEKMVFLARTESETTRL